MGMYSPTKITCFTLLLASLALPGIVKAQSPEPVNGVELTDLIRRIELELLTAQKQQIGAPDYQLKKANLKLTIEHVRSADGSIKILIPFLEGTRESDARQDLEMTFAVPKDFIFKGAKQDQGLLDFELASEITQFRRSIQTAVKDGLGVLNPPNVVFRVTFGLKQTKGAKATFTFHILQVGGELKGTSSANQVLEIELEAVP